MSIADQDHTCSHDATARAAAIAQRCAKARLQGQSWQGCCPAHEDDTPSLSITPRGTRVLVKCHKACATEAIMQALGLPMAYLFVEPAPTNGSKRIVAVYDYYDADGTMVHQTVRYEPKRFSQRQPDPAHPGAYLWNLKGIEPVLYNLPAVLVALQAGARIHIVEGEKDVENLRPLGLTATTNPMGAGKWRQSYADTLRGAEAVIFPDNDAAGRTHAATVARSLTGMAATVTVVPLPGLPDKGDVSDWLRAGGTLAQLEALVAQARTTEPPPGPDLTPPPSAGPIVIDMDTVRARAIEWLWYPYLAIGKICILDGDPGVGKTLFATQLAANVSRGHPMPDQEGKPTLAIGGSGTVVFIATEDDLEDTVKPRLDQAGADCTKIKAFNEWEDGAGKIHPFTLADLPHLDTVLSRYHPRLVYIDAIQAVLGGKIDPNRANQLKELLDPLTKLAAKYRCAILASRHPAKPGQNNVKLIHRGANSMAIIGTARLGLFAEDHPTDRTKVLLLQSKSNAGAIGLTQIFSKAGGAFEWTGVSRIKKEDLAGPAHGPDSRGWLDAYFWLERRLEGGLPWSAKDIETEATSEVHDFTSMALRKAKKALGVISRQPPGEAHGGWTWQLPPFPLIHYPSSPTDSSEPTNATGSTDTPDQKTMSYERRGSDVAEWPEVSEVSDVSVDGVVTEDILPPVPDCLPAPCVHCHGTIFWHNAADQLICSRCHPQPRERK